MGYSPWGRKELDRTERLHFQFSLSLTGEGNGNPLQYFCLENPRDGGAWWAAVYWAAQSQTQLKQLSSSSSRIHRPPQWLSGQESTYNAGDAAGAVGQDNPLEKEMATHLPGKSRCLGSWDKIY